MQDRYTGDVGDFGKYGLLRILTRPDITKTGGRPLSLGIVWYRYPDESHNDDGRHITYLGPPKRDTYRKCDPELYDFLGKTVTRCRAIAEVENSNIFCSNTRSFPEYCPDGSVDDRMGWLSRALDSVRGCDLVFLDPDNGLREEYQNPISGKHAYLNEVLAFIRQGSAVVLYHHPDRSRPHNEQIKDRAELLKCRLTNSHRILAFRYRRGTSRALFVMWPTCLDTLFEPRVQAVCEGPWVAAKHFDLPIEITIRKKVAVDSGVLHERRLVRVTESSAYRCPIPDCEKVFHGSRGGWDAHVGSYRKHRNWHPEIKDSERRKRLFKDEYPQWFHQ